MAATAQTSETGASALQAWAGTCQARSASTLKVSEGAAVTNFPQLSSVATNLGNLTLSVNRSQCWRPWGWGKDDVDKSTLAGLKSVFVVDGKT